MSDIAKGSIIGVIVAIVMLSLLMEFSGMLSGGGQPPAEPGPAAPSATGFSLTVDRIGPDGKPDSDYGDELANAEVPGSEGYDFCAITGINVQRPSMLTSSMPDAGCVIERRDDGKWLVSTGNWQSCQVSCFKIVAAE